MTLAFPKPSGKKKSKRKSRDGMSKQHLSDLHELPCIITGQYGVNVHHLKQTGDRGGAMKSADKWGIPLRHDLHMQLENAGSKNEIAWFQERGVANVVKLAEMLWEARGDIEAMKRIILMHKGKA